MFSAAVDVPVFVYDPGVPVKESAR